MIKYYGVTELAKELGWNRQKTHVYYKRGKFIEPAAQVGNRPLWDPKQVKVISNQYK